MGTTNYLVSKGADVFKVLSIHTGRVKQFDIEESLIYSCQKVRSNKQGTGFEVVEKDIVEIPEEDVFMIDTNYHTIRYGVDRALGIID